MKKLLSILILILFTTTVKAQLELPYPVKVVNPRSLDGKYLYNGNRPYTDTSEVNATIPIGIRHKGLIVNVANQLWWYKDSTLNNSLVQLITAGGSPNAITQVIGDYGLLNINDSTLLADTAALSTLGRLYKVADSLSIIISSKSGRVYAGNGLENVNDSTLRVDTFLISTKNLLYKVADSIGSIINGRATFGDVRDIVNDSMNYVRGNFQPLENQRLSTGDNVGFNNVSVKKEIIIGGFGGDDGKIKYTDRGTGNVGNLTNGSLTDERIWYLPDRTGIVALRSDISDSLANVVKYADTASMLNPYLRKVDTAEFVKKTRTLTIGKNGSATDLSDDRVFLDSVPNINTTNATNITSGTLNDARLSNNVALKNIDNLFSSNQTINKITPKFILTDSNGRKTTLTRNETYNNYTMTNNVLEVGGALSNGIKFTNANQYMMSSPVGITGVTSWSVSFWMYKNSSSPQNVLYFGDSTNNYQIVFCCGGNGFVGVYYNGVISGWFSVNDISNGAWRHVVVTKSISGYLKIYINGALENSPYNYITNISNIKAFRVGSVNGLSNIFASIGNAPLNQTLDQVLFYDTVLSLANVQSIYNGGVGTYTIPTSHLKLRYEFNEGIGTTTAEGSPTNATGTFVNGMSWVIANGKIPTELTYSNSYLVRSIDGIYTGNRGENKFGDPLGGTWVSGRSVKFTRTGEDIASLIHDRNGNTLLSPNNTYLDTIANSTISIVGNVSIGSNTAAPTNGLQVVGKTILSGLATNIATKTANYTLTDTDYTILANANDSTITITLPTAVGRSGQIYNIIRINNSGNDVNIVTTIGQTINDDTSITLSAKWQKLVVQSTGSNWVKLN